jgi:hypothetical protein
MISKPGTGHDPEPLQFSETTILIFSLNSPCIFIILDIHQQNAQITNKVQLAP